MLGAARKTEVVITHTPHRQYSSAFAVPMFGRAEFGFNLDGERTPYTFGKDPTPQFYYTATQDGDDAVRIKIEDEKHRHVEKLIMRIQAVYRGRVARAAVVDKGKGKKGKKGKGKKGKK